MKLKHEIEEELARLKAQRESLIGAIQALEWSLVVPPPVEAVEDEENAPRSDR